MYLPVAPPVTRATLPFMLKSESMPSSGITSGAASLGMMEFYSMSKSWSGDK